MEESKIITGSNEQEVWATIEPELTDDLVNYEVVIAQGGEKIQLVIDIDPGGGFESGYAYTQFRAPLLDTDFRFAIHHEDFIDSIGKFLGMQDIETGYTDFDKEVIVKANDEERVHRIFSDADVREVFAGLEDFHFGIHTHQAEDDHAEHPWLEFYIDDGITESGRLRQMYHAFYTVLKQLNS